jgi:hypothetical protein
VAIEIDWQSLKKAGLEPDLRISIELEHVAAGDILYWILRPLPAKAAIVWSLSDGKFKIAAQEPPAKP